MWTFIILLSFLIFIAAPIALLVGLIKPRWVRTRNRKRVILIYGGLFIGSLVLGIVSSDQIMKPFPRSVTSPTPTLSPTPTPSPSPSLVTPTPTPSPISVSTPSLSVTPVIELITPKEIEEATPKTIGARFIKAGYNFPHKVDIREKSVVLNFTDNRNSPLLETQDTKITNIKTVNEILLKAGLPLITQTLQSGEIRGERSHYKYKDYSLGEFTVSRTVCARSVKSEFCIAKIVILREKTPLPSVSSSPSPKIRTVRSRDSISGSCQCPYDRDSAGRSCGARSAYSKPGGNKPLCFKEIEE